MRIRDVVRGEVERILVVVGRRPLCFAGHYIHPGKDTKCSSQGMPALPDCPWWIPIRVHLEDTGVECSWMELVLFQWQQYGYGLEPQVLE